jgi:histidine ammonia-lyase
LPNRIQEVELDGESLTVEKLHSIARDGAKVKLSKAAKEKIRKSEKVLKDLIAAGEPIYGVTTGIGDFYRIEISREESEDLQHRVVRSHAAGYGNIFSPDIVKAAMVLRINCIAKGISGVRISTVETLVEMVNRDVVPVVHEKGSLGASGDLSPMAELANVVIGEGEAFFEGERMPGAEAMKKAGLEPVKLAYKEGIGLINGTQMMTAVGALVLHDAFMLFKAAQIASAMSADALRTKSAAYDARLQALRPFYGQSMVAANLRQMLKGSELMDSDKEKLQDAYSLRCVPQVLGPVHEALEYIRQQVEIEINSGTDNPAIIIEDSVCISGGNFHGQPVAAALDYLGIVITFMCGISERHTNRMLNPRLSGLPDFLVESRGLNSGMMLAQYTAAALTSENKILAHPACVDSIPVSADQEDFVPMGMTAALKARDILTNAFGVIAIEMMCAAQAIEFRAPGKPGAGPAAARAEIRKIVKPLEDDRPLHPDIEAIAVLIRNGIIQQAVENAVGPLK